MKSMQAASAVLECVVNGLPSVRSASPSRPIIIQSQIQIVWIGPLLKTFGP